MYVIRWSEHRSYGVTRVLIRIFYAFFELIIYVGLFLEILLCPIFSFRLLDNGYLFV